MPHQPLDFVFTAEGKEKFKARLQSLIGARSVRAAAKEWGVPASTINNYLHKETEPSLKIACLISDKEQVSLEWLAYGQDKKQSEQTTKTEQKTTAAPAQALIAAWEILEPTEQEQLTRLLTLKGAEILIKLLESGSPELLKLTGIRRDAALRLTELPESIIREILEAIENRKGGIIIAEQRTTA